MKTVRLHEKTHAKVEKLRQKIAKKAVGFISKGEVIDLAVTEKLERGE